MTTRPAMQSSPPSAHIADADVAQIDPILRAKKIWVCWGWRLRDGKWDKPPIDPRTGAGTVSDPSARGLRRQARDPDSNGAER